MKDIERIVETTVEEISGEISEINYKIRELIDKANKGKVLKEGSDSYEYIEGLINEFATQTRFLRDVLEHPEKADLEPRI